MNSSPLGGITRSGTSGSYSYSVKTGFGDKPVNFVSFWDAARFTNWLTSGNTETGVYRLNNVTNPVNNTITRDATAWANGGVAIASENEWYKAAYYDGNGGYFDYPPFRVANRYVSHLLQLRDCRKNRDHLARIHADDTADDNTPGPFQHPDDLCLVWALAFYAGEGPLSGYSCRLGNRFF